MEWIVLAEPHDMFAGGVLDDIIGVAEATRQGGDLDAAGPAGQGADAIFGNHGIIPGLLGFDKAPWPAQRERGEAQTISSVRDARIGIPHRTDEPLGQVFDPGIRPRGSENSLRQARSRLPGQ